MAKRKGYKHLLLSWKWLVWWECMGCTVTVSTEAQQCTCGMTKSLLWLVGWLVDIFAFLQRQHGIIHWYSRLDSVVWGFFGKIFFVCLGFFVSLYVSVLFWYPTWFGDLSRSRDETSSIKWWDLAYYLWSKIYSENVQICMCGVSVYDLDLNLWCCLVFIIPFLNGSPQHAFCQYDSLFIL